MADKRMFSKTIIDSDAFLDMPLSAQALYFHLAMRADDEGFINNPKKIQRVIGASDDDGKLLIMKKFLIPFESGVVVIKHWFIHNYIRQDRLKPTNYEEERACLTLKKSGSYTMADKCQADVRQLSAQNRLDKNRLDEFSVDEDREPTPPTKAEVEAYVAERGNKIDAGWFFDYYNTKGWMIDGKPVTDWKTRVASWEKHETKYQHQHKPSYTDDALQKKANDPNTLVYKPRGEK